MWPSLERPAMSGSDLRVLIAAIRGPVLLIALGTLFAIDHEGGYSFARTWPVLIILWGLLELLARLAPRNPGAPPQNPGGTGALQGGAR